ncbi:hypothetical protein D3C71_2154150 [compost metagenome]
MDKLTAEQFAYWLQGFVELSFGQEQPTRAQWSAIKDHLQQVFKKVTPDYNFHVTTPNIKPFMPTPVSPLSGSHVITC